jgi:S-adenosylmethionine synthetase
MNNFVFTSESVCSGHPDKICDSVSDAILDAVLAQDKFGRVAVETMVTFGRAIIAGEISTTAKVDLEKIVRNQIKSLGYTDESYGFWYKSPLEILVHQQSPEIAKGVKKKGAGDQGMMFGYACRDTKELMPLPIMMAHGLVREIDQAREKKVLAYLRPDGKSQVTVEYKNGKPVKVSKVVVAVPHNPDISYEQVKADIFEKIVSKVLAEYGFEISQDQLILNGTGVWHQGGPASDTGLTGRKIIVDTYGGFARVGGGCFSGKDPTKVDRSGAYAARFMAKNIVANGLSEKAEISLAYVIGKRKPVMVEIETFGTEKVSIKAIKSFCSKLLNPAVDVILDELDLRRPIYKKLSAYGHFGREGFPWEKIVKA